MSRSVVSVGNSPAFLATLRLSPAFAAVTAMRQSTLHTNVPGTPPPSSSSSSGLPIAAIAAGAGGGGALLLLIVVLIVCKRRWRRPSKAHEMVWLSTVFQSLRLFCNIFIFAEGGGVLFLVVLLLLFFFSRSLSLFFSSSRRTFSLLFPLSLSLSLSL